MADYLNSISLTGVCASLAQAMGAQVDGPEAYRAESRDGFFGVYAVKIIFFFSSANFLYLAKSSVFFSSFTG